MSVDSSLSIIFTTIKMDGIKMKKEIYNKNNSRLTVVKNENNIQIIQDYKDLHEKDIVLLNFDEANKLNKELKKIISEEDTNTYIIEDY